MPVTKKKGAIFEIYADSPLAEGKTKNKRASAGSSASASVSVSASIFSSSASASPSAKRSSTSSIASLTSRKALASLPVATTRSAAASASAANKPKPLGGPLSATQKLSQSKKNATGSKLSVIADTPGPASASVSTNSRANDPRQGTLKPTHAHNTSSSTPAGSGSGSAVRKMQVFIDVPPNPYEPKANAKAASSTTSVKRRPLGAVSSASASRPLGSSSSSSSTRPLGSAPAPVPLRTSAPARTSSRGAFSIFTDPAPAGHARKRERATTPDKENAAPSDSPSSRTRSKAPLGSSSISGVLAAKPQPLGMGTKTQASSKQPLASKKQPLSATSTKRRFDADAPLADVSVAYEAWGAEPEGFRTQAMPRRRQAS